MVIQSIACCLWAGEVNSGDGDHPIVWTDMNNFNVRGFLPGRGGPWSAEMSKPQVAAHFTESFEIENQVTDD